MTSQRIQKLTDLFSKFPTIGPKTAARFVFYLIGQKKSETDDLIKAIQELKSDVKTCSFCFNPFEPPYEFTGKEGSDLCYICANSGREKSLLCVVEKEADLNSIEKTKKYNGRYFILGGTISRLKKADIEKLRIKDLLYRIKCGNEIKEIISDYLK
jgi:recombination protein RecR